MAGEKTNEEFIQEIAENISRLAGSVQVLLEGKLKKRAIVLLLVDSSGLPQYQVSNLLDSIANLENDWIKKKKK